MSQTQNNALPATQVGKSLVSKFASRYDIDGDKLLPILKATAFKLPAPKQGEEPQVVSNEQMAALLVVADQYKLNPFTREIYAFPDKSKGIVPIVGVDGWARIINEHPQMDGLEFRESEKRLKADDDAKECPEWIEALIYRKDRARPIVMREYLDECYRPTFNGKYGKISGPWQSHTKRFLRHKALIQCARVAFGFAGIYDEDEGERVLSGPIIDARFNSVPDESKYDTAPFDAALVTFGVAADDGHLAAFIAAMAEKDRCPAEKVKAEAAGDMDNFIKVFRAWAAKNYPQAAEKQPAEPEAKPEAPAATVTCPNRNGTIVRVAVECAKCKDRKDCPALNGPEE